MRTVEARLDALGFHVGQVDGLFDDDTTFGVQAFQKVAGLDRDGRESEPLLQRLNVAQPPPALVAGGGATRVEIDLPRQVLFLYENDRLSRIVPVSSGSGEQFCTDESCGVAVAAPWRVSGRLLEARMG